MVVLTKNLIIENFMLMHWLHSIGTWKYNLWRWLNISYRYALYLCLTMNRATLWYLRTEMHRQIFFFSLCLSKSQNHKNMKAIKKWYFALVAWHVSEWNVWGIQKIMCLNSKWCCPCSNNSNKCRKLSQTRLLSAAKVIWTFFCKHLTHRVERMSIISLHSSS